MQPMQETPMKCEGTTRDGQPCGQHAVTGGTHCKTHGGITQAKRGLKERRQEINRKATEITLREKALARRDQGERSPYRDQAAYAVGPDGDVDDPLQVARALAWRALAVLHALSETDDVGGKNYAAWLEMARRMNDSWAKIRTDERYVRITAAQAFGLMAAVDRAMVTVGLDGDTQDRLRAAVAEDMARARKQLLEVDG